jgi:hypothetical protein
MIRFYLPECMIWLWFNDENPIAIHALGFFIYMTQQNIVSAGSAYEAAWQKIF